ncbi:MAG: histidinol-phosphate transaminase, partial [Pseudomonadota bacterium]
QNFAVITPNTSIGAMAPYALADLRVPDGVTPVSLAQNEHVYAPSAAAVEAAMIAMQQGNLYPDADWIALREAIAKVHKLDPGSILCGAGSMELIVALGIAYLNSETRVLISEYGYAFMRTVAQMVGAPVDRAPEQDYCVDVDALLGAVQHDTRVLFLANPGNPTGTRISAAELRELRARLPASVLLIIDEAYAEFVEGAENEALFDLVQRGDTVVLRTFSKIYGLAGLRVGWGCFPAEIVATLRKSLTPSNVSLVSQAAASTAIQDQTAMVAVRGEINRRRDTFAHGLRELGLQVPRSHTNFVLMEFASADAASSAFEALRAQGVLLRPMGGYGLHHCLRATIGSQEQVDFALDVLRRWVASGESDDG